jgi:hypothetical protein
MTYSHKTEIHKNVFTRDEINILRQDQHQRPVSQTQEKIYNKNLDYHLPESVPRKIIKPKLDSILGPDHIFKTGCYKDAWRPYATHVDTYDFHERHYNFPGENHAYNCAVLIPLNEDPSFRTVIFDVHSEKSVGMGAILPEEFLTSQNDLDPEWFTHIDPAVVNQIKKLPVDKIFHWRLGDLVIWPRTALHSSTDFAKFGLFKKFIIIFID